jgi:hypothetical protein
MGLGALGTNTHAIAVLADGTAAGKAEQVVLSRLVRQEQHLREHPRVEIRRHEQLLPRAIQVAQPWDPPQHPIEGAQEIPAHQAGHEHAQAIDHHQRKQDAEERIGQPHHLLHHAVHVEDEEHGDADWNGGDEPRHELLVHVFGYAPHGEASIVPRPGVCEAASERLTESRVSVKTSPCSPRTGGPGARDKPK